MAYTSQFHLVSNKGLHKIWSKRSCSSKFSSNKIVNFVECVGIENLLVGKKLQILFLVKACPLVFDVSVR